MLTMTCKIFICSLVLTALFARSAGGAHDDPFAWTGLSTSMFFSQDAPSAEHATLERLLQTLAVAKTRHQQLEQAVARQAQQSAWQTSTARAPNPVNLGLLAFSTAVFLSFCTLAAYSAHVAARQRAEQARLRDLMEDRDRRWAATTAEACWYADKWQVEQQRSSSLQQQLSCSVLLPLNSEALEQNPPNHLHDGPALQGDCTDVLSGLQNDTNADAKHSPAKDQTGEEIRLRAGCHAAQVRWTPSRARLDASQPLCWLSMCFETVYYTTLMLLRRRLPRSPIPLLNQGGCF